VGLETLKEYPFSAVSARTIGPTLYDSIIIALPVRRLVRADHGPLAPPIASVVNLLAAELGVSIVPASMPNCNGPSHLSPDSGASADSAARSGRIG